MIYLKNNGEKQDCFIPKNLNYEGKKTYKEGVEYQKSLIEPITITENGIYENENGFSPVNVNIPFGGTTITENGIYDIRNGYMVKSDEEIGTYWNLNGGGFVFELPQTNEVKIEVLYKPYNGGEINVYNIRGIFGYKHNDPRKSFYVAEDVDNSYKLFASVGEWRSESVEITNDWHIISLSNREFCIDGIVVASVPEDVVFELNDSFFINGLSDNDTAEVFYSNVGYYQQVKVWCDGEIFIDGVPYYNSNDDYGYLNLANNNQKINEFWRVISNFYTWLYTDEGKPIIVKALNYIDVQVGECPDLTELSVTENGVYEGAFNRVDVNVADTNGSYDDGYNQGYQDGQANCEGGGDTYPTIKDIYNTEDTSTEVSFKGIVAVCHYNGGTSYRMIVTDHTGAFYIDATQPYDIGDECIFTGAVKKINATNIRYMSKPLVEVLSKNNYVVMPTDAVELTNVNDLYIPNEYGNAEMKYLYFQGEVQRFNSNGNIDITAPESVSERRRISLRGSKEEWRNNLVVGDNVRVYMFTANSDGYFIPTDLIKLGTESGGGECPELTTLDVTENGTYEGAYNIVNVNVPQDGENCILEHLDIYQNGYYEPKAEEFSYLIVNENSAFDTGVKLVENSTIEIYFNTGSSDSNIPTLIGCEDADWSNNTFAVRWYGGSLSIKIGTQEISIPMGAEDEAAKLHKLKFGRYEGVYLDDNYIESFNSTEWTMNQNTIYIGAMHNPTNGDTNGVWRPWNGYIGNVKIYGEKNGEVRDFTFTCGDFGKWGEFETEGSILPNIMGEGGATYSCCKQYGTPSFDGYSSVNVNIDVEPFKEEGRNEVRNNLQTIDITENGRYSTDDTELRSYIEFDGNSYFDTNIPFGENSKIEIAIFKTTWEGDEQIIGVANFNLLTAETYGGFGIVLGAGLAYGVFGQAKTNNIAYYYDAEKEVILTLDRNGINSNLYGGEGWIDESGLNNSSDLYGQTIGLGRIKSVNDGWVNTGLNGRIRYVKIWTDGNDDSTMTLFQPKNMAQGGFGLVNSEGVEYNYIENLGEGTTTFISEYVKKYGEGWKEINVNVPTIQEQIKNYYYCPLIVADAGFGEAAQSWSENYVILNNYDGAVIEDVLYVPTFGNRNEFRTKERVKFVQRIDIPSDNIGSLDFGNDVEYYVNNSEGHTYTNLTKIVLGDRMSTLNFGSGDSFPAINEIWDYSTTEEFDVFISTPSNIKSGGTLYLKTQSHESEWRNNLPEDWTIEYI